MGCFEVLEDHEGIQDEIARRLQDTGAQACGSAGQRPALLVVSPRAALRGPIAAACRTALLPGDPPLPELAPPGGQRRQLWLRPRDTLTLSSREGHRLWLALQRELVTVQGQVVERQEFPWRSTGASPGGRRWPGPFCCFGSLRNRSPPCPSKNLLFPT